ncbi:Replication factor C, subunit RFC4 [Zalaria obscura]|uniref:Replication factor C, subunit RFC4 n=1 Tax=Zalaria obscura TaxID=2024903 RepID=A0ACC3S7R8_9PEZI
MKILTKEEEQEHYNATVRGGLGGGAIGGLAGFAGVWGASKRYPFFNSLTLPFKAFLVVSSGTFAAIISADSYSRHYEQSRHPEKTYKDEQETLQSQIEAQKPLGQRINDWASTNRYSIVFASWVASMGTAFGIVGRNPYLTGPQKLVQARVYAQGLTLAVVIASLALEAKDKGTGQGRWETVKVLDPNDPTHKRMIEKKIHHERYAGEDQWMDMVEAEEQRIKEREEAVKQQEEKDKKNGKGKKSGGKKHEEENDRKKS